MVIQSPWPLTTSHLHNPPDGTKYTVQGMHCCIIFFFLATSSLKPTFMTNHWCKGSWKQNNKHRESHCTWKLLTVKKIEYICFCFLNKIWLIQGIFTRNLPAMLKDTLIKGKPCRVTFLQLTFGTSVMKSSFFIKSNLLQNQSFVQFDRCINWNST